MMINNKKIGLQIKNLRVQRGWKQLDLADKMGLSRPAISNIESGKRSLTLATLKKVCEVFEIDISYFGIETDNLNEAVDITTRITALFNSDELPEKDKDELYRTIMQIYLNSKNK